MDFETAFAIVVDVKVEGGFSLDPRDKGNWTGGKVGEGELRGTNFGISAAAYPSLDIKSLTLADARGIYRRDYWDFLRADQLTPDLKLPAFDMAVNQGKAAAAKTLQRAARVADDGAIGPATIAALWQSEVESWVRFTAKRNRRYAETLGAEMGTYGEGWFIRAARIAYKSLRSPRSAISGRGSSYA